MRDEIKATLYTAIICFVIFLIMLAYRIVINVDKSIEFAEVFFDSQLDERESMQARDYGIGKATSTPAKISNLPKVELPAKLTIDEEEILPQRFAEKIDLTTNRINEFGADFKALRSEGNAGFGKEIRPELGISAATKSAGAEHVKGEFKLNATPTISYKVEWEGKVNRIKIGGEMPRFPQGVRESAIVKFKVVVLPDGTIERIFPMEKANPEFESSVLEALRSWRFNPINEDIKQTGVITFNFRLE